MIPRPCTAGLVALTVCLSAPGVRAAEPAALFPLTTLRTDTFYPPLKNAPPIVQLLKDSGGLVIGGYLVCSSSLGAIKLSPNLDVDIEANATTHCKGRGVASGQTLTVRCVDAVKKGEIARPRKLSITLRRISPQVLLGTTVCDDEMTSSGVMLPCDAEGECTWTGPRSHPTVEVIPAAERRDLFEAVKAHFASTNPRHSIGYFLFLFEGPPATNPRTVSEIFYVGNAEQYRAKTGHPLHSKEVAEDLAKHLETVIGKVAVKQWPGDWDYDVVVVVGSEVTK